MRELALRVCDAAAVEQWNSVVGDDPAGGGLRAAIAELAGLLDIAEESVAEGSMDRVTVDLLYEAAGTFSDDWYRAFLLADLVPHLAQARLCEVAANDSISNIALPHLVPHLSPEQIQTVLDMVRSRGTSQNCKRASQLIEH